MSTKILLSVVSVVVVVVAATSLFSRCGRSTWRHTPLKSNEPIEAKAFSGGHEFKITDTARAVAPNITPDPDTGLGKWSEQQFLDKFAEYKAYAQNGSPKIDPELNTAMPWVEFSKFETADLKAIYAYLRTVPAISNGLVTHPDAPEEKRKRK